MHHPILRILLILAAVCVLIYLGLIGMVCWKEAHVEAPQNNYDAIIVLGAQVKPDGEPSVQLQWRLDAAAEAYLSHPCIIVVCGAKGSDEPDAEAHVMRDVLLGKGIPEDAILMDDTSFNTRQNLLHASELLEGRNAGTVLIVTSDYHLPRALRLAEDQGFHAVGLGSPTLGGWWWLKNHAREALAWVKYWIEHYLHITL